MVGRVSCSGPQQLLGADPEALERCADQMVTAACSFERISLNLSQQVSASTWTGSAASRFRFDWQRGHAPDLRRAAASLRGCADRVRTQAAQQRWVSQSQPARVPLGPLRVRTELESLYRANRESLSADLKLLRAERERWLQMPLLGGLLSGIRFLPFDPLEEIDKKVGWLEPLVSKNRKFIFVDTRGGGHAVEVFGDLQTADHVAVLVPGVSTDLGDFAQSAQLPAALLQRGRADTAAVQWLGYDPPSNLVRAGQDGGLNSRQSAHAGAVLLSRFVDSLRTLGVQDITVIGHSLGAYLVAVAAGSGQRFDADRLVLVGSPGSLQSNVSQLHLHGGAGSDSTVFSMEEGVDPIATGVLGHSMLGWDVADPNFGATQLVDGEVSLGNPLRNHSAYFSDAVSLQSLQAVISGSVPG